MSNCHSGCPEPRAEVYDKRRFFCLKCGLRFKDKWMLKRHVDSKVCLKEKKARGSNKKHKEDVGMAPAGMIEPERRELTKQSGEELEEYDLRLPIHFKIYLVGPSRSGKTTFCMKLLRNLDAISKVKIEKVFWVYSTWQEGYTPLQEEGLVDEWFEAGQIRQEMNERMEEYVSEKVPLLIIFDDCMHVDKKTLEFISKLFTLYARHKGVSIVFIRQKFFGGSEFIREIDRNADVCVVTNNPREGGTVCKTLARQMGSIKSETLTRICDDATAQNPETQFGGYLWINLNQPKFVYLTQVLEHQGHFMMSYQMDKQSEGFRKMILLSKLKYNELLNNNNRDQNDQEVPPSTPAPLPPPPAPLSAPPPPLPTPPPPPLDQIEEDSQQPAPAATVALNPTLAAVQSTNTPSPSTSSAEKRERDDDDDDEAKPKLKKPKLPSKVPPNSNVKKRKIENDDGEKQKNKKKTRFQPKRQSMEEKECKLCDFTTKYPKVMIDHVETEHPK